MAAESDAIQPSKFISEKIQARSSSFVMGLRPFLLLLAFLLTSSQGINKNTGQEGSKATDPKPIYERRGGYQKALQVEI